ncbi:SHOCT domain-containing protein [Xylanimonas sp. McL0601]|uniref:SHOCT domain-containing protein n=1 Tax=Xylanimonas sp. McL0601 TaxID=3414739 RepID=UPI003CFB3B50
MLPTLAGTVVSHPVFAYGGGFGWWFVFPLLWFALILTAIILFARARRRAWADGAPWARSTSPDPVAILGERYARGEIDEAEYRTRLAVLRPTQPGA